MWLAHKWKTHTKMEFFTRSKCLKADKITSSVNKNRFCRSFFFSSSSLFFRTFETWKPSNMKTYFPNFMHSIALCCSFVLVIVTTFCRRVLFFWLFDMILIASNRNDPRSLTSMYWDLKKKISQKTRINWGKH